MSLASGDFLYTGGSNFDIKHEVSEQNLTFHTSPAGSGSREVMRITHDGHLSLSIDSGKIKVGSGNDLQIYHDGSNSHIKNTGSLYVASETSGDLYLRSDDDIFIQPQGGENGITLTGDGAVTLYHDNAVKLATTSTGVTVTGNLTLSAANGTLASTGNLYIGTDGDDDAILITDSATTLSQNVTVSGDLKVLVSGGPTDFRMQAHRNDVGQNMFSAYFSRGTSASPTIVQDGDTILEIQPKAYDGANYHRPAEIDFQIDGTPGTNDMPGRIVFWTTADGASAPTERMRISASGAISFGSYGSGTYTGTVAKYLAVDSSGNVIEESAGAKGQKGQTGGTGPTGSQGSKGQKGAQGGTGPTGSQGSKAVSYTHLTLPTNREV